MTSTSTSKIPESDGFILIAVLCILATLAVLASTYATYVRSSIAETVIRDDYVKAHTALSSAVDLTFLRLSGLSDASRSRGGRFFFVLGEVRSTVDFQSEAGRVDLNGAAPDLLASAFIASGTSGDKALTFAKAIVAWRSPKDGSNSNDHSLRLVRKFRSPDELHDLRKIPDADVTAALSFFTTYTGSSKVDILAAPERLLAVILGGSRQDAHNLRLSFESSTSDDRQSFDSLKGVGSLMKISAGAVFRIHVESFLPDGYRSTGEIVAVLFDQAPEPYGILSWRENSE